MDVVNFDVVIKLHGAQLENPEHHYLRKPEGCVFHLSQSHLLRPYGYEHLHMLYSDGVMLHMLNSDTPPTRLPDFGILVLYSSMRLCYVVLAPQG